MNSYINFIVYYTSYFRNLIIASLDDGLFIYFNKDDSDKTRFYSSFR